MNCNQSQVFPSFSVDFEPPEEAAVKTFESLRSQSHRGNGVKEMGEEITGSEWDGGVRGGQR